MSFFLVFLAIVLVGAVVWAGAGGQSGFFRRGGAGGVRERLLDGGFEQPVANLPPVLLPADAAPADVDRVRFSLGLRGYRMDQVDQVLDDLRDQLAAKRGEVEQLTARLLDAQRVAQNPAGPEPEAEPEPGPAQERGQAPPGPGRNPAEDGV